MITTFSTRRDKQFTSTDAQRIDELEAAVTKLQSQVDKNEDALFELYRLQESEVVPDEQIENLFGNTDAYDGSYDSYVATYVEHRIPRRNT